MSNKLVQFYEEVLKSISIFTVNKDGELVLPGVQGAADKPVQVQLHDGTVGTITLPTDRVLKEGNFDGRVLFHPACEQMNRGNSEVLNRLQHIILLQMKFSYVALMTDIVRMSADKEAIESMKYSMGESAIVDALNGPLSKDAVKYWTAIGDAINADKTGKAFIGLSLRKGAKHNGEVYNAVAKVNFNILNQKTDTYFDLKCGSKKGADSIKYMIENIILTDNFVTASQSTVAPRLISLLTMYGKFVIWYNNLRTRLNKSAVSAQPISSGWIDNISIISEWKHWLPQTFEGNQGQLTDGEVEAHRPNLDLSIQGEPTRGSANLNQRRPYDQTYENEQLAQPRRGGWSPQDAIVRDDYPARGLHDYNSRNQMDRQPMRQDRSTGEMSYEDALKASVSTPNHYYSPYRQHGIASRGLFTR